MLQLFLSTQWDEIYDFFAAGHPPLITQLLLLNTICFALWIARRMRGAPALRPATATYVQSLLLFSNALILFEKDVQRLFH